VTDHRLFALLVLALLAPLAGCSQTPPAPAAPPLAEAPPVADPLAARGAQAAAPSMPGVHAGMPGAEPTAEVMQGTVEETMNASTYTYMRVNTGNASVWVAAMAMPVSVGDRVEFQGATMANFHSASLDRTFDAIIFANMARVQGAPGAAAPTAPAPTAAPTAPAPTGAVQAPPLQPGQTELPPGHPPIGAN